MQFIPYLDFDGNCAESFDFYAQVFRGRILMRMTYGESPMAGECAGVRRRGFSPEAFPAIPQELRG